MSGASEELVWTELFAFPLTLFFVVEGFSLPLTPPATGDLFGFLAQPRAALRLGLLFLTPLEADDEVVEELVDKEDAEDEAL